jgi:hypothetical protein
MLSRAVSAVFESWNSERAIKYREHHNVRGLAGTAVTVMTMFPSERSGILFTEDPNRPDQGRIIIEASYGLGEAIVRGHVEPDVFCVDRKTTSIVEKRVNTGKDSCVSDAEVLDLAKLGLDVEAFYKTPVDVEWGIADGKLCLLQSRPCAALDILRAVPKVREEEIRRLEKARRRPAEGRVGDPQPRRDASRADAAHLGHRRPRLHGQRLPQALPGPRVPAERAGPEGRLPRPRRRPDLHGRRAVRGVVLQGPADGVRPQRRQREGRRDAASTVPRSSTSSARVSASSSNCRLRSSA